MCSTICCICFNKCLHFTLLQDAGADKITVKEKVTTCIPNQTWFDQQKVCNLCISQIYVAYNLIKKCENTEEERRELFHKFYEESLTEDVLQLPIKQENENVEAVEIVTIKTEKPDEADTSSAKINSDEVSVSVKRPRKESDSDKIEKKPFECKLCWIRYEHKGYFENHLKSQHGAYPCCSCDIYFTDIKQLRSHNKVKHKAPVTRYFVIACSVCGLRFRTQSAFDDHMPRCSSEQFVIN